jgi:hypothetical protein
MGAPVGGRFRKEGFDFKRDVIFLRRPPQEFPNFLRRKNFFLLGAS